MKKLLQVLSACIDLEKFAEDLASVIATVDCAAWTACLEWTH